MVKVKLIAASLVVLQFFVQLGTACGQEISRFQWQRAAPEDEGMSSAKLDALRDDLARRQTQSLLVIRNDRIVYQWYAKGRSPADQHGTASLAKAVVGGMMLAVALNDERVRLDDPVSKFVPEWRNDSRKAKITLRQLGSHASGLSDAESDGLPHDRLRSPLRTPRILPVH